VNIILIIVYIIVNQVIDSMVLLELYCQIECKYRSPRYSAGIDEPISLS